MARICDHCGASIEEVMLTHEPDHERRRITAADNREYVEICLTCWKIVGAKTMRMVSV